MFPVVINMHQTLCCPLGHPGVLPHWGSVNGTVGVRPCIVRNSWVVFAASAQAEGCGKLSLRVLTSVKSIIKFGMRAR